MVVIYGSPLGYIQSKCRVHISLLGSINVCANLRISISYPSLTYRGHVRIEQKAERGRKGRVALVRHSRRRRLSEADSKGACIYDAHNILGIIYPPLVRVLVSVCLQIWGLS